MGYKEAPYSVNKRHDFSGIHDISGNFPYDDIFRKNHARLYSALFSPTSINVEFVGLCICLFDIVQHLLNLFPVQR